MNADIVALPGRVAEGLSRQVDVTIGIGSDQVEEKSTATFLLAADAQFVAASARMASEQFHNESRDLKETVEE